MHDDGYEVDYYIHNSIHKEILTKAKKVVHEMNNSFVCIVDGKSGVGKSTFAIQIAKNLDPNFTIDKIAWTPKKLIDLMEHAKKGDAIMFDEGMAVNSRSATSAINKAIIISLSQIRSRNIFIIININSIFDIDKAISIHRADILFHIYTKDDKVDGEKRIKVYGRRTLKFLYIKGKKFYDYSSAPNFFARPPKKYVFLINEKLYEARKRKETMENVDLEGNVLGRRESIYRIAFIKLVDWVKKKYQMTHLQVSEVVEIDSPRISKIISWAKDKKYIEDDRGEVDASKI